MLTIGMLLNMEYSNFLLVSVVLIHAAICHATQVITGSVGQNIILQCPVPNPNSDLKFIYWKKNGTTIYSLTSNGEYGIGKYTVINTTSLVIPDLINSNAGNYSCKVVRHSLKHEEREVTLYTIDLSVSHCNDSDIQHGGEGCSCYINGANLASLECSASGFPHPPVITWDESQITHRTPSVNLTRFNKNVTLVCKARDGIFEDVSAKTRSVCVYYSTNDGGRGDAERKIGSPKETSQVLKITLPLVLIALLMLILLIALWKYRRRMENTLSVLPRRFRRTSSPKSARALEDLRFSTLQHQMKSVEDDMASVDLPQNNFNEDVIFDDVPEISFPLVGQVLLDDLRSSSEDVKKSLKAVVIRLLNKRVKPYKEFQLPMDSSTPLNASLLQNSMKESMIKESSNERDVAFVELVLSKLDQILDETDRDECEILITKPDFQEVTDDSQIPTYEGNIVINRSIPLQTSMRSSMKSSGIACSLQSSVIREELKTKTPSEKTTARIAISQIILDALRKRQRAICNLMNRSTDMLPHTEAQFHGADDLGDETSRLVALWASKLAKLDDEVKSSIEEYLYPLKPNKSKQSKINQHMQDTKKEPIGEPVEEPMKESKEEPVNEHDASDEEQNESSDTHHPTGLDDSFQK